MLFDGDEAKTAVVRIGEGGRGFLVDADLGPMVVTAGHCLHELPEAGPFHDGHDRTYKILGALNGAPMISVECLFVDPVSDISVLGPPDGQEPEYTDDVNKYDELCDAAHPLIVSAPPTDPQKLWLLSLDQVWFSCSGRLLGNGCWWLENATNGIVGGMSGSPILDAQGHAVGVVSTSLGRLGQQLHTCGGPNPNLASNLPGWLLSKMALSD